MTQASDISFGERLRRLREAAGLTQEELAERVGLTPDAIGVLERGARRHPYPNTVRALADALGLSSEERAALAAALPKHGAAAPPTPAPSEALSPVAPPYMPLLATKLYLPRPRARLVLRPRLLARPEAGLQGSLTLIAAPPGLARLPCSSTGSISR